MFKYKFFPLSFNEMIEFYKINNSDVDYKNLLWHYIRRGGFPSIHISNYDEDTAYIVLNDIYDSIVLEMLCKDIKLEILNYLIEL